MKTNTWILVIEEDENLVNQAKKALNKLRGFKKIRCFRSNVEAMHYMMQLMEYELAYPDMIFMDTESRASKDVKFSDVYKTITLTEKHRKTEILSLTELLRSGAKLSKKIKKLVAA
ncbi:hypothetical protein HRU45_03750 [Candidatus Dependentiae bacterium]|nr:hypothetical protein [Candidatus Dependentiae bacterium]